MRFGAIKVWAHRLWRGAAVPIFRDNRINRAIDAHVARITAARTKRRRREGD